MMEPKLTGKGRLSLGKLNIDFDLGGSEPGSAVTQIEALKQERDAILERLHKIEGEIKRLEG